MSRLQHRPGRKSNYVKKLQSKEWQEVCRRVRLRDGHRCQICGRNYSLEVHHTTYYDDKGVSIVGREAENWRWIILFHFQEEEAMTCQT